MRMYDTHPRTAAPVAPLTGRGSGIGGGAPGLEPSASGRGRFRPDAWINARQRGERRLAALLFRSIDALAVWAVVAGALMLAPGPVGQTPTALAAPLAAGAAALLAILPALGVYRFPRGRGPAAHLGRCLLACLAAALLAGAAAVLLGGDVGRVSAGLAVAGGSVLLLHGLWWSRVAHWRRTGVLTPNIAIVGATQEAEAVIAAAAERRDLNIIGVFDDRLSRSPVNIGGAPVLGDAEALLTHRVAPYLDHILVAIDPNASERLRELTQRLAGLPTPVTLLVEGDTEAGRDAVLDRLARAPLADAGVTVDADRRAFHKRMQDLALSAVALILVSPLMLGLALLIRLDSPGPVFFRQRRHGFNHEAIVVWKFRTMRHEAADATASRQVGADDDRVTRVGRVLRSTSLDEVPQLLNVLAGEMSLVGPRPHAIGMKTGDVESARLVSDYAQRHRIKPGMTGWAAVKGSRGPLHSAEAVRHRVQLDLEYIERLSLWLDLWIMLVTLPVLLGDRMAQR
jgi:polysaccharide biosynthesis protein PslA